MHSTPSCVTITFIGQQSWMTHQACLEGGPRLSLPKTVIHEKSIMMKPDDEVFGVVQEGRRRDSDGIT